MQACLLGDAAVFRPHQGFQRIWNIAVLRNVIPQWTKSIKVKVSVLGYFRGTACTLTTVPILSPSRTIRKRIIIKKKNILVCSREQFSVGWRKALWKHFGCTGDFYMPDNLQSLIILDMSHHSLVSHWVKINSLPVQKGINLELHQSWIRSLLFCLFLFTPFLFPPFCLPHYVVTFFFCLKLVVMTFDVSELVLSTPLMQTH